MLSLAHGARIFLCREATDMRLGYEGLRNLAATAFSSDPYGGSLFVFFNRGRNRCKILVWDKGGFWLLCKRLERGTFAVPEVGAQGVRAEIDRVALAMFLDGVVAKEITRKSRFIPSAKTA